MSTFLFLKCSTNASGGIYSLKVGSFSFQGGPKSFPKDAFGIQNECKDRPWAPKDRHRAAKRILCRPRKAPGWPHGLQTCILWYKNAHFQRDRASRLHESSILTPGARQGDPSRSLWVPQRRPRSAPEAFWQHRDFDNPFT